MRTVISLKLVTGEEVVAEAIPTPQQNHLLTEGGPTGSAVGDYVLRRPHVLQFQQVAPGQLGLALVPYALSNPSIDSIRIPAAAVVTTFEPAAKVEKQYLEQTSGISLDIASM